MAQPSFQGQFIWHELLCSDTSAASAFYERILPWKAQPFSPGSPYLVFLSADRRPIAGLMRLSDAARSAGAGPHWRGYIGAEDVDAIAGQAVGLGARIQEPVQDVPGVGRVALLSDPEGATFGLYCPSGTSASAPASSSFAWNELAVRNREAGLGFYQQLFGWQLRAPVDMGGGFFYQTFGFGSQDFGGAYTIPADRAMPPAWCPYASASSADEIAGKVLAAGGQLAHGPIEVPGGGRIVQFFDPQRAFFAVHSMAVAGATASGASRPAARPSRAAAKAAKKSPRKSAKKAKKPAARAKRKVAKRSPVRPAMKSTRRRVLRRLRRAKRKLVRKVGRAARNVAKRASAGPAVKSTRRRVVRRVRRAKRKLVRKAGRARGKAARK